MILFDIIFGNDMRGTEELFVKGGKYNRENGTLELKKGEKASFENYFSLFPHHEYLKYCGVEKIELNISAEGNYRINFYERVKNGKHKLIKKFDCRGESTSSIQAPHSEGGYVFFTLEAQTDCILRGGSWATDSEAKRPVKLALVICTYNREKFLNANLDRIGAAIAREPEWANRLHAIVIDNAKTLGEKHEAFYDIIPNRNLGGSGGFARGLYEADNDGTYTHYLLMDDDIKFDFSVIKRTWYLLSALVDEHAEASVGGAMLVLEKPHVQHEFGGRFTGMRSKPINSGLDMRKRVNLLKNQSAQIPDYNAWWYCCMPASCVKKYGLPMPFFIKSDDTEYGMRVIKEFIRMSGIAVWHQGFDTKYSQTLEYYIARNCAATSALRLKHGRIKAAIRFAYFMFRNLTLKNYDCVELIYNAYRDFKAGSKFFIETDPVALNEKVQSAVQIFAYAGEIKKLCGGVRPALPKIKKTMRHNLFACFLMFIENYMPAGMFSDKIGITDVGAPRARDCFMKKTVVHYAAQSGRGYIFKLDTERRRKLRRATYRVFFGMIFLYGRIRRDYRKNQDKMCSRENWEKMFFNPADEGTRKHAKK